LELRVSALCFEEPLGSDGFGCEIRGDFVVSDAFHCVGEKSSTDCASSKRSQGVGLYSAPDF
jgi:hypothetical protein